jgi:hypothetical protein
MPVPLRPILCLGLLAVSAVGPAQEPLPSLQARASSLCEPEACARAPGLRLLGVLELPAVDINGLQFSQLSGLAWDDDDGVLYTVSDKGMLFGLRPAFRDQRLVDVSLISAAALIDPKTRKPAKYRRSDSEGLDILHGRNGRKGDAELLVSYEGDPRIAVHRPDGSVLREIPLRPPLSDILQYQYNRMLEGVCVHPREGILTVPEEPLKSDQGATRLYRRDGVTWRLAAARGGVVALECLPDGDVLVLEREFSPALLRLVITLRRVHLPAGTAAGSLLGSETLAVLDSSQGWRRENFEGLAHHRGNRFFMISDDNDTLFQHTLLVYFELSGITGDR